ncbi:hypothetical protein HPG69_019118, partial [Diceros bicornis minor]
SESRSTDSPIIIEPLSKPNYKNNSPQVVPHSSSELCSALNTFTSSLQHPVGTALSVGGMKKNLCVSKRHSTSEVNSVNSKRPKLSDGIIRGHSSALSPSGIFHTMTTQQSTPSNGVHTSLSYVQNGAPFPTAFPKDSVHFKPINPVREDRLEEKDFLSLASENKTVDPKKGNLIVLLHDFYYGQHEGDGQPEQKTHTTFKCLSCLKVLKNVKFMNHMKHHLELEKQRGDSWENHTTCQHCHRQFPTPFQLQCHIESNLLCPFCLKIFKTATPYMCHYRGHWEKSVHQCSKCRLQFLTFKEKMEHKTQCHQMFKKPKQLEGLPPETKVVIQVSLEPLQPGSVEVASVTVSTSETEPSPPRSKIKFIILLMLPEIFSFSYTFFDN